MFFSALTIISGASAIKSLFFTPIGGGLDKFYNLITNQYAIIAVFLFLFLILIISVTLKNGINFVNPSIHSYTISAISISCLVMYMLAVREHKLLMSRDKYIRAEYYLSSGKKKQTDIVQYILGKPDASPADYVVVAKKAILRHKNHLFNACMMFIDDTLAKDNNLLTRAIVYKNKHAVTQLLKRKAYSLLKQENYTSRNIFEGIEIFGKKAPTIKYDTGSLAPLEVAEMTGDSFILRLVKNELVARNLLEKAEKAKSKNKNNVK